ncbi:MAG: methylenetetrahydrofolate reductase [Lachnospiraceae bacterium]|nr:methylenetetrahydrofolate reductase [NAD(P)H] [Lachnospiraceae bacterium]
MKINDVLNDKKVTLSFEVFPPKKADGYEAVKTAVEKIASLHPSFMSITYGAGGTTAGFTMEIAEQLMKEDGVTVLPHFTCVSSTRPYVEEMLRHLDDAGVENIMALRGDLPQDGAACDDFAHAVDLIRFIKERSDLCVGGACYPEGHIESVNKADDLRHLKEKVDAGCDFLTTQMFFDNNIFYNFLYRARDIGIFVPILPGIMPITTARQLKKSVALSQTNVPERFRAIVDCFGNDPAAMKQAGIIYASEQIIDLIANGVTHVHVYSMNKPDVAEGIMRNISAMLGK